MVLAKQVMAKTSNIERTEWRARCRLKLAEHLSNSYNGRSLRRDQLTLHRESTGNKRRTR